LKGKRKLIPSGKKRVSKKRWSMAPVAKKGGPGEVY